MHVEAFKQGAPRTFVTLLCDGYVLRRVQSVRTLVEFLEEKSAVHPSHRLLATLDNFAQACYTSGHATDTHDLDNTDGHDLSAIDAAAFENGEHLGYLTTKSEFFIRRRNLASKAAATTFVSAHGKLFWSYDGQQNRDFFELNSDPNTILDTEIYVQIVPVRHSYESVSAFPNGYFSDDLTPMEVSAVARQFEEQYGYTLFGIGASYLGFARSEQLSDVAAHAFAADILSLYRGADATALTSDVARVATDAPFVLLNYTAN